MEIEQKVIPIVAQETPDCGDKDEDCPGIEDKVNCWLYAPERGMCPFLRTGGTNG
jgi:hypothetical protein